MHRTRRTGLVAILAAGGASLTSATALADVPVTADRLRDSVGVNVHVSYTDTTYGRWDDVLARLTALGVRHVRDGVPLMDDPVARGIFEQRLRAAAAGGARLTALLGDGDDLGRSPEAVLDEAAGPLAGTIEALEPPNESDLDADDWTGPLRRYTRELAAGAASRPALSGLPLLAPSLGRPQDFGRLGDLGDVTDRVNVHPYGGGDQPTAALISWEVDRARQVGGGAPVVITEIGWTTGGRRGPTTNGTQSAVTERAQAAYTLRVVLEALRQGVERTFLYELADQKPDPSDSENDQHFGLLGTDLQPKPAYTALRRLLDALGTGGVPGPAVPLSVTGPDDVRHLLLRRADGGYTLALWREAPLVDVATGASLQPGAERVVVGVNGLVGGTSGRPLAGTSDDVEATGGLASIDVPADPVLLRLDLPRGVLPGAAPRPATSADPSPTASGPATPAAAGAGGPARTAAHARESRASFLRRTARASRRTSTQVRLRYLRPPVAGVVEARVTYQRDGRRRTAVVRTSRVRAGSSSRLLHLALPRVAGRGTTVLRLSYRAAGSTVKATRTLRRPAVRR